MIDGVLKLLGKSKPPAGGLDVFSSLLIESAFEHSLAALDSAGLAQFAQDAFTHLINKPHRGHAIRVRRTNLLAGVKGMQGAPDAVSAIEVLDDDMPYLVESVIAEINHRGLTPLLVFHPIFKTSRYGSGGLREVLGPGDRDWASGDQESFISVLVGGLDDSAVAEVIEALNAALTDVRHVANDAAAMHSRLQEAIASLEKTPMSLVAAPGSPSPTDVKEAADFLRWLDSGNFDVLGMREYELVGHENQTDLWPKSSGAFGVLRQADVKVLRKGEGELALTPDIRAFYNRPEPVFVTKASELSRVRARVHFDTVGVKRYSTAGKLIGELRIVGLFTQAAYLQSLEAMPIIRQKVRQVKADAGFPPDSHNGRTLISVLEDFPRDELLQIDAPQLLAWALAIVDLRLRPRPRVLVRREQFGRFFTVLSFVPRDVYSTTNRERIGQHLADVLGGRVSAFFPYYTTGPLVRTRFIIGLGDNEPNAFDTDALDRDVVSLLRTWAERLEAAISVAFPADRMTALTSTYRSAFSAAYSDSFDVARAVEDIKRIDRLGVDRPIAIDFYCEQGAPANSLRAAIYRFDKPIPLSERVPVLENFGFRVIDERSYRTRPQLASGVRDVVLHDMVLESADGSPIDIAKHEIRLEDAFLAVTQGLAENDPFNALVVGAGLEWQEAALLRSLGAYLRQARAPFGMRYMAETLTRHAAITRLIFELIRSRFDTAARGDSGIKSADMVVEEIETALAGVSSLDEDRILRRYTNLAMAIVRTTFFSSEMIESSTNVIAFKLDSHAIEELPEPKPYREIFVYSPRVEGIHLRFGKIARGGIRWSDRAQDFRTEVLGLAKAQQVKNTVIVASGAKGGFVPKLLPRGGGREEIMQEGVAAYKTFITALLSLTDDIVGAEVVPPAGVVRYDGDDPYLVVAADKGTATFSDYANEISTAKGFWLGDAFASGGSTGYDHKKMGITARGAWECVRRHFLELGVDIQSQPFKVIGIGDMSGDVFGNGMLLSPQTQLVAAVDHRDIFIDPEPDPAISLAERRRLFALPRSSWGDYDKARISAGGGVFARAAKSIQLSAEMRDMFGVTALAMTPNELVMAILRAKADLLWFGGIGTFIRASSESDEQVGDRTNDPIRITAEEVGVRVIGEGANLGITQRARIEAAERGIRLNADFIDNSAGVNTSDEEVNIKIALEPAVTSGRLQVDARNRLLADMTEDVAAAVLLNNVQQGLAISLAERTSARDINWLGRLAKHLEDRGLIERKLEVLPSEAEFTERAAAGRGLTRPELAVLLSWAKIALDADLLASDVPDEPGCETLLADYFPPALRQDYSSDIAAHRLRREIIATRITNSLINRGGPAFAIRLGEETQRGPDHVARAFLAVRSIFQLPQLWAAVDALEGFMPAANQLELYQKLQDLLIEQTGDLLRRQNGRPIPKLIETYGPAAATLLDSGQSVLGPKGRRQIDLEISQLEAAGVPASVAAKLAILPILSRSLEFTDQAVLGGSTAKAVAAIRYGVEEYLRLAELRARAASLPQADEYDRQAIDTALTDIEHEARKLGARLLADASGVPAGSVTIDVGGWVIANAPRLAKAKTVIDTVLSHDENTVSRLAVAAKAVSGAIGEGKGDALA